MHDGTFEHDLPPACLHGYALQCGTARVAFKGRDKVEFYPAARHAAVFCNNRVFRVDLLGGEDADLQVRRGWECSDELKKKKKKKEAYFWGEGWWRKGRRFRAMAIVNIISIVFVKKIKFRLNHAHTWGMGHLARTTSLHWREAGFPEMKNYPLTLELRTVPVPPEHFFTSVHSLIANCTWIIGHASGHITSFLSRFAQETI